MSRFVGWVLLPVPNLDGQECPSYVPEGQLFLEWSLAAVGIPATVSKPRRRFEWDSDPSIQVATLGQNAISDWRKRLVAAIKKEWGDEATAIWATTSPPLPL